MWYGTNRIMEFCWSNQFWPLNHWDSEGTKNFYITECSFSGWVATRNITNSLVLLQKLCKNCPHPEKLHGTIKFCPEVPREVFLYNLTFVIHLLHEIRSINLFSVDCPRMKSVQFLVKSYLKFENSKSTSWQFWS